MRLLIIGGSVFLGRAVAAEAIRRGHQVTIFCRGVSSGEVPADVDWIKGDRDKDVRALSDRKWDAAIDTCGYFPRQVQGLLKAIGPSIGHYTFISSVSAYADLSGPGVNESHPLAKAPDPNEGNVTETTYGPLKSACEEAARKCAPCPLLLVRPGIIVGPGDPTGRLAYWLGRLRRGGEILAPGEPGAALQLIDVRDIAAWLVAMAQQRNAGVFNAVGKTPFTLGEMLLVGAEVLDVEPTLTWVSDLFLTRHRVTDWLNLPFFVSKGKPEFAGGFEIDGAEALRHGLSLRPFRETVSGTARWLEERRAASRAQIGLTPGREFELLSVWHASPA